MTTVNLYPSAKAWPSNILRFHFVFDQAMDMVDVMEHIALLDTKGHEIEHAFLDLPNGLWDSEQQVLTVLFHPGRVKTGLGASLEMGPILEPTKQYRLVLKSTMRQAYGMAIGRQRSWVLNIGEPLTEVVDVASWSWERPQEGTQVPVELGVDRPMDILGMANSVRVLNEHGDPIPVSVTPSRRGASWSITPNVRWPSDDVRIETSDVLEDVAGNRVQEEFEIKGSIGSGNTDEACHHETRRLTRRS